MRAVVIAMLFASLSIPAIAGAGPMSINVDCDVDGQLERAVARAEQLGGANIFLHGVCEGGLVIATNGVSLRGATPDAAIVAPDPAPQALVEVVDSEVVFIDLRLEGAEVGVLVDGWGARAFLDNVEMTGQSGCVFARSGATAHIINSSLTDGDVGVVAQFNATVILDNVLISGHDTGVSIFNSSRLAMTDSTIENSETGGLQLEGRCDGIVWGGEFSENGQIHVFAGGRSDLTLLAEVAVGSETDSTEWSMGVNEHSSITSFNTSEIWGDISALDRGSLNIGNALVHGTMFVSNFSDALIQSAEIEDGIYCKNGSDAVCQGGGTASTVNDCPSTSCAEVPVTTP